MKNEDDKHCSAVSADLTEEREALAEDIAVDRERLAGRITPSVWRLMDQAIKLLRNCDCQNPEPRSGAAGVSEECPFHNDLTAARAEPQTASTKITDQNLRRRWREAGGEFYGPHVETGSMPEAKLLPFLRSLLNQSPHCQAESAEAIEAEQDERRRVFGPFSWDEPQAESAK
jgi:hypothetical protein